MYERHKIRFETIQRKKTVSSFKIWGKINFYNMTENSSQERCYWRHKYRQKLSMVAHWRTRLGWSVGQA